MRPNDRNGHCDSRSFSWQDGLRPLQTFDKMIVSVSNVLVSWHSANSCNERQLSIFVNT